MQFFHTILLDTIAYSTFYHGITYTMVYYYTMTYTMNHDFEQNAESVHKLIASAYLRADWLAMAHARALARLVGEYV